MSNHPVRRTRERPLTLRERAVRLAERCNDAYSYDRYKSWPAVAQGLLKAGYTERQAETIMRSKIARWAADQHNGEYGYGEFPGYIVADYATEFFQQNTCESLQEWVLETLGVEPTEMKLQRRIAFSRRSHGEVRWYVRHDGRFYRLDPRAVSSLQSLFWVKGLPWEVNTRTSSRLLVYSENDQETMVGHAQIVGSVYDPPERYVRAELAEGIDREDFR